MLIPVVIALSGRIARLAGGRPKVEAIKDEEFPVNEPAVGSAVTQDNLNT